MLDATSADVVHITTPPQSHFPLASQCLKSGAHVYVKKPFTITAEDADSLIHFADACTLKITAGHNYQFTQEMLETRRLVDQRFLGGNALHLESHFSYRVRGSSYGCRLCLRV